MHAIISRLCIPWVAFISQGILRNRGGQLFLSILKERNKMFLILLDFPIIKRNLTGYEERKVNVYRHYG
jgi:hypothetical protein